MPLIAQSCRLFSGKGPFLSITEIPATEELASLAPKLSAIARDAGEAILDIYQRGPTANSKADGSPVTEADQIAEQIILTGLAEIAPDVTVISEENAASHSTRPPRQYFLVDPLDGTREFLKADGKGEFTVNIALVKDGFPVFGVLYVPVSGDMYVGGSGIGAWLNDERIRTRPTAHPAVALASLSHRAPETRKWLEKCGSWPCREIGSSLKFGLLARGEGDIYPRFNPTMEWDIAAGQAVLEGAGGAVQFPHGTRFAYGKPGYRNGPFFAFGDPMLAERLDMERWT